MTIEELDVLPELPATADLTDDGLMPCWVTFTCWYVASSFTTTWYE